MVSLICLILFAGLAEDVYMWNVETAFLWLLCGVSAAICDFLNLYLDMTE